MGHPDGHQSLTHRIFLTDVPPPVVLSHELSAFRTGVEVNVFGSGFTFNLALKLGSNGIVTRRTGVEFKDCPWFLPIR